MANTPSTDFLRPVRSYSAKQYPNLRLMTGALESGKHRVACSFTPAAARELEARPEILLHHELYDRRGESPHVYRQPGKPNCALRTEFRAGGGEMIKGWAADELAGAEETIGIDLATVYPDKLLPFDLYRLKNSEEKRLAREAQRGTGDRSLDLFEGADFSADPFLIYQMVHSLKTGTGPLAKQLSGVENVLEIGSGLGLTSFLLARLLGARVCGVEIDARSLERAAELKARLQGQYTYDLSKVDFVKDDIMNLRQVRIEDYGLLIGWSPLYHGMPDGQLAAVLQGARPETLFFQMMSNSPFSSTTVAEKYGFHQLEIDYGKALPLYKVFEKLS